MDAKRAANAVLEKLKSLKYVLLVLLVGLALLLMPSGEDRERESSETEPAPQADLGSDLEARLAQILSLIDGAGDVRVLLTYADDGERVLARDTESTVETRSGEARTESSEQNLVVQRSGGGSEPVEVTRRSPVFRGAVVAAQGAGNAAVRLELLEAVKAATGLTADAVKIVKMK